MWGYTNTVGDLAISVGHNQLNSTAGSGTETGIGLTYTAPIDDLTIVAGRFDDENVAKTTLSVLNIQLDAFLVIKSQKLIMIQQLLTKMQHTTVCRLQ